jgi:hypothetical protein
MLRYKVVPIVCSCLLLASVIPAIAQEEQEELVRPAMVTAPFAVPVVPIAAPKLPREATGLADIIRAKYPLTVQYKDLGAGWRELSWQETDYFTKGDAHWLNGKEFLVAYKPVPRLRTQLRENDYVAAVTDNAYPHAPEDRFEITLLEMADLIPYMTNGNTNLRSFDPARRRTPFDASNASRAFHENLSLVYLRKIYEALNAYSTAYLNVLPPLETAFAARQALQPFAENTTIFTQPGTSQPFKTNPLFSNRKRAHLRKRGHAVIFYEVQPASDGLRAVMLLNGTVRRVDAKSWRNLKAISNLD